MDSITRQRVAAIFGDYSQVQPLDRLYLLSLLGITQRQIARELGFSPVTVHQCLFDKGASHTVACKIAELTSVPLNRLWPDGRYDRPPRRKVA